MDFVQINKLCSVIRSVSQRCAKWMCPWHLVPILGLGDWSLWSPGNYGYL